MSPAREEDKSLLDKARAILEETWKEVSALAEGSSLPDQVLDTDLIRDVRSSVNSATKTYRYVLPTQVLAKAAKGELDCRCLQASRGGKGAFDARTIAHKVVVPFDQANERVLGGSSEPYVNNPLRVPDVSSRHRPARKDPEGWDALCRVLDRVEQRGDSTFTRCILKQILIEVRKRLESVRITYPAPGRISLDHALGLVGGFLSQRSGGDRLLAMAAALFVLIGQRFRLYSTVRRAKITAADASTEMLADLECVASTGEIALVVEAKDRDLTITQIKGKLAQVRERKVSEMLFIAQNGVPQEDKDAVDGLVAKEFAGGQNVYITDLVSLAKVVLTLVGERGRREFLVEVGTQLDQYGSAVAHRQAWAELLSAV